VPSLPGHVTQKELFGVNYVPLTDAELQDSVIDDF
jgi:hypothetical protein